jgi:hypothetical protein
MYNRSKGISNGPLLTCLRKDAVFLIGCYICYLKYVGHVLIADCSVVYISCVLGTFVLDYDLSNIRKFLGNTYDFVNPTPHIFICIVVYFLFCKIILRIGTSEGNSYCCLFRYIVNLAH